MFTLKTLTSLDKESRPFFQATIAFRVFRLFLPLAITAIRGPAGYFRLAIIAFRAFGFTVPKYFDRSGKNGQEESRLLNSRRLRSSRYLAGFSLGQVPGLRYFRNPIRGPRPTESQNSGNHKRPESQGFKKLSEFGRGRMIHDRSLLTS